MYTALKLVQPFQGNREADVAPGGNEFDTPAVGGVLIFQVQEAPSVSSQPPGGGVRVELAAPLTPCSPTAVGKMDPSINDPSCGPFSVLLSEATVVFSCLCMKQPQESQMGKVPADELSAVIS